MAYLGDSFFFYREKIEEVIRSFAEKKGFRESIEKVDQRNRRGKLTLQNVYFVNVCREIQGEEFYPFCFFDKNNKTSELFLVFVFSFCRPFRCVLLSSSPIRG